MDIRILKTADEIGIEAAKLFTDAVKEKPDCVLGLATGSSPLGTYKQLIDWYNKGDIDFSGVTSVNLDEYIGQGVGDEQSYVEFMRNNLFNHIQKQ